jgi:hypothetical protein
LKTQYDDLVSQKFDVEENVKRQRDLLFQARGILERVTHRLELLKADEPVQYVPEPGGDNADDSEAEPKPSAARPSKTLK